MDEVKNTNFDELLSETVRKFPCLYDKTKSEYKDRNICRNPIFMFFFLFQTGVFSSF